MIGVSERTKEENVTASFEHQSARFVRREQDGGGSADVGYQVSDCEITWM